MVNFIHCFQHFLDIIELGNIKYQKVNYTHLYQNNKQTKMKYVHLWKVIMKLKCLGTKLMREPKDGLCKRGSSQDDSSLLLD